MHGFSLSFHITKAAYSDIEYAAMMKKQNFCSKAIVLKFIILDIWGGSKF